MENLRRVVLRVGAGYELDGLAGALRERAVTIQLPLELHIAAMDDELYAGYFTNRDVQKTYIALAGQTPLIKDMFKRPAAYRQRLLDAAVPAEKQRAVAGLLAAGNLGDLDGFCDFLGESAHLMEEVLEGSYLTGQHPERLRRALLKFAVGCLKDEDDAPGPSPETDVLRDQKISFLLRKYQAVEGLSRGDVALVYDLLGAAGGAVPAGRLDVAVDELLQRYKDYVAESGAVHSRGALRVFADNCMQLAETEAERPP